MMNHHDGWMNGWAGAGVWFWPGFVVGVVALLVVLIMKRARK